MAGLHGLLGEYVGTLSSRVLTRAHSNETEVRVAKAGAVGKRLIWSNETKEGDVFDDDVLKALSSRDPIRDTRWHHQRPFTFTPTHTLWMRGAIKQRLHAKEPLFSKDWHFSALDGDEFETELPVEGAT